MKNGKVYIGQTKSSMTKRFSQHCETRNKTVIGLAIKKYGKDNFTVTILIKGIVNKEELDRLEIKQISKHNSISPNGYNVEPGGNTTPMTEVTKNKISKKLKGRSVTWGHKVSISVKKLWEDPVYRKTQTEQRCKKRGSYKKGIIRPKLRKNINIKNLIIDYKNYMTVKCLCEKYNISFPTLYRILKIKKVAKRGHK